MKFLESSEAHLGFDDAIAGFAPQQRGVRPPGAAHTAWQLLEQRLVTDSKRDLLAQIHHPEAKARHTLLREALLLADHNAYHVGQLVLLRRLLTA